MKKVNFENGSFVVVQKRVEKYSDATLVINDSKEHFMVLGCDFNVVSDEKNGRDCRLFFDSKQLNEFSRFNKIKDEKFTVLTINAALKCCVDNIDDSELILIVLKEFDFIKNLKFNKDKHYV